MPVETVGTCSVISGRRTSSGNWLTTTAPTRRITTVIMAEVENAAPSRSGVAITYSSRLSCKNRRCFRAVDPLSDRSSKLIAIDEETNHQIMHGRRFGKANRATHETLDPGPQIDVFALDFLRILL